MMPLGQGLPSPATMLFNHPIRGIMPVIKRLLVGSEDEEHSKVIIDRHSRNDKSDDTSKGFASLPIGSTVAVQKTGLWTHGTI